MDARVSICVAAADGFSGHSITETLLTGRNSAHFSRILAGFISLTPPRHNPSFHPAKALEELGATVVQLPPAFEDPAAMSLPMSPPPSSPATPARGHSPLPTGPVGAGTLAVPTTSLTGPAIQSQSPALSRSNSVTSGPGEAPVEDPAYHPDFVSALVTLFAAVDCVCIVPPASPYKVAYTKGLIDACRLAHVKNVLLVSCLHSGEASIGHHHSLWEFLECEDYLKRSGIQGHCIVRPTFYQQNLLLYAPPIIASSQLPLPIGDQGFAPLHLADLSACVAEILSCKTHTPLMAPIHQSAVYSLTGPAMLSGNDMASILSKEVQRVISFAPISRNEAKRYLEVKAKSGWRLLSLAGLDGASEDEPSSVPGGPGDQGAAVSKSEGGLILELLDEVRLGKMEGMVTSHVKRLTGDQPRSLDVFVRENVNRFKMTAV